MDTAAREAAAALTRGRGVDYGERRALGDFKQLAVVLRLFDGADDGITVQVDRNVFAAFQHQRTIYQPGAV